MRPEDVPGRPQEPRHAGGLPVRLPRLGTSEGRLCGPRTCLAGRRSLGTQESGPCGWPCIAEGHAGGPPVRSEGVLRPRHRRARSPVRPADFLGLHSTSHFLAMPLYLQVFRYVLSFFVVLT